MTKSEFPARVSAVDEAAAATTATSFEGAAAPIPVLDAPARTLLVVASVGAEHEVPLAREGFGVGAQIEIERTVGLGGPAIVRVGSARIAIARSVLATVAVSVALSPEQAQ